MRVKYPTWHLSSLVSRCVDNQDSNLPNVTVMSQGSDGIVPVTSRFRVEYVKPAARSCQFHVLPTVTTSWTVLWTWWLSTFGSPGNQFRSGPNEMVFPRQRNSEYDKMWTMQIQDLLLRMYVGLLSYSRLSMLPFLSYRWAFYLTRKHRWAFHRTRNCQWAFYRNLDCWWAFYVTLDCRWSFVHIVTAQAQVTLADKFEVLNE